MRFIVEIDCDSNAFRDEFARQQGHQWVADPDAPNPEACVECGDVRAGHDDGYERKREVSRILSGLAWNVGVDLMESVTLRDVNGATVGTARFVDAAEESYEVGSSDWTEAHDDSVTDESEWCGAASPDGMVCTRLPHDVNAAHVAGDGKEIVGVWR